MVGFVINQQTLVRKEVSPARLHLVSLNFALPAILEVALIARDGDVGSSHSNKLTKVRIIISLWEICNL